MLRTLCSTFPFMVCLCWFVTFALRTRHNDSAKRVLTIFLGTCTVLYLCHAFYFNGGGLNVWGEALWALCSLSVYPLYYIYITHLTCQPFSRTQSLLALLPGAVVALCILFFPSTEADTARKMLNAVQIFTVLYFGYRRLQAFDRELANIYADTDGRDTAAIKTLLIAFVATSLLSVVANIVGKQNVAASQWMVVVLIPFGILLYSLSYIGYTRKFTQEQIMNDMEDQQFDKNTDEMDDNTLERRIEDLMAAKYFLTKNLKITDLAQEVGSCRTYVSSYINKKYNCSFSEYVNQLRVEYAKQLMQKDPNIKMSFVSEHSGFANEQAFYRNFKRFVGTTPTEWRAEMRETT